MSASDAAGAFRAARDFMPLHRTDDATARDGFRRPRPEHFDRARDWFDVIAEDDDRTAPRIVEEDGTEIRIFFRERARRSPRVANRPCEQGVRAGDRVLAMLGEQTGLGESARTAIRPRAVIVPATPLLGPADPRDRIDRDGARHALVRAADTAKFAEVPGKYPRIAVGAPVPGRLRYDAAYAAGPDLVPGGVTRTDEPLMLCFTSGTTAEPKPVEHTHASYPIAGTSPQRIRRPEFAGRAEKRGVGR
jgi:acetyl-CoA synthetase